MTLETTDRLVIYRGNGATTEFPFNFIIPDDALFVKLQDYETGEITETLAPGSYTAVGLGEDEGGTITYPLTGDPLSDDFNIIIEREVEYKQELDIPDYGGFNPNSVMRQLDNIVMQIQQLAEVLSRAVVTQIGQTALTPEEISEFVFIVNNINEGVLVKTYLDGLPDRPDGDITGLAVGDYYFNGGVLARVLA